MPSFTFFWEESPRIIQVNAPDTVVTVQQLVNAIRQAEAEIGNLDDDHLIDAVGKDDLGGGIETGIVLTLRNAQIKFEDRAGPDWTRCIIQGGTVVRADGGDPIKESNHCFVVVNNQVGGVIATASGDVDAIAAGVWNRQAALLTAAGSIGKQVKDNIDAAISSRSSHTPADVRAEMDNNSVGLNTLLARLTAARAAKLDNLDETVSSRAATGDPMTLTTEERENIANALLDLANSIEDGFTLRQTIRIMAAILAGKSRNGPANSIFRNLSDTKDRVVTAADANGNRSVMNYNVT